MCVTQKRTLSHDHAHSHTNKQKHFSFDLILTHDYVFSSDHADRYSYGVVRHFVGHGVGRVFHADPVVQHFSNRPDFELSSVISFHILCGFNNSWVSPCVQPFTR
jgi:methionine aminopeptidase